MATKPAQLERGLGLLEATSLNMTFMVGIGPFVVIPFVIWQAMHGPLSSGRMGGGGSAGSARWLHLGGTWRGRCPRLAEATFYLREAYGPGRWGRLISVSLYLADHFSGAFEHSVGRAGFCKLFRISHGEIDPRGRVPENFWHARAERDCGRGDTSDCFAPLPADCVQIGKISVVFSVVVFGTILWIIWGGATHFNAHRVFDFSGAPVNFSWVLLVALGHGSVQTIYSYLGYYNVCNLGGEMKNPERNIPRAIFISILGITVLYLAMQTSILSVIPWREAQTSSFIASIVYIERAHTESHWATLATVPILLTALGIGVFGDAGIFARSLCRGARRKFLFCFFASPSEEAFSVYVAARSRRRFNSSVPVLLA